MTAAEQVPLDADSADPQTSQESDDPELEPVTYLELQPGWALPPNAVIRGQNSAAGPNPTESDAAGPCPVTGTAGPCPVTEAATAVTGAAELNTSKRTPATDSASAADVSCPSPVQDHLGIPGAEKVLRLAERLQRLANEEPSAELIRSIEAAHKQLDPFDREPLRFPRVVKRPTLGRFKTSVRKATGHTGAQEIAR